MKRLAFNGGEISPAMTLRSDMDAAPRSCSLVTNWNILATGGISRRRGMRHLTTTQETTSRLIPYRYSAEQTSLIEIAPKKIHVRDSDSAAIIATFTPSAETPWQYPDLNKITWLQINSLLLILSPHTPIMQLQCDDGGGWTFSPFEFVSPPWQTEDYRDIELTLTPDSGIYRPSYTPVESDDGDTPEILPEDTQAATGDILRASYYTTRREAFTKASTASADLTTLTALTTSSNIPIGRKIAWQDPDDTLDQYYICTADWTGTNDLTPGYISPANYPDNFDRADSSAGFDPTTAITELTSGTNCKKGDKIVFRSGYYNLYYCIRPFNGSTDFRTSTSPRRLPPPLHTRHPHRLSHPLRRKMAILLLRHMVRHLRNPPQLPNRSPHRTMGTPRRIHLLHRRHRQQPHHRQRRRRRMLPPPLPDPDTPRHPRQPRRWLASRLLQKPPHRPILPPQHATHRPCRRHTGRHLTHHHTTHRTHHHHRLVMVRLQLTLRLPIPRHPP